MKKILGLIVICLFFLCGCGKINKSNILDKFEKKLIASKSYTIDGKMQIISNEEKFDYNIEVSYLKDDYYKVVLVNQTNNHEQIILKNDDGVYVVTPALNKSFKFQSEWPNNSSQAYILESIYNDLKNDKEIKYETIKDGYILTCKVIYPNNSSLSYQKVYFDKDANVTKVEVYNKDDQVAILVLINNIDYKAKLNKSDFALDNYIQDSCCDSSDENCSTPCKKECEVSNCDKETTSLESAIYPLYVPTNSALTGSEKIKTENGNRLILSFAGDNDFVLVEETVSIPSEMEIIPVYGDPHIIASSVVALGANSLHWTDNNVDFYLASNTLSGEEMLTIANSMSYNQTVSQIK